MAVRIVALLLTLHYHFQSSLAQITNLGVPRKRYFKDTPWGQVHYAASPSFDPLLPTLLLFHGNPDSMIAYANLLQEPLIKDRYNFLAFDYFGCGSSDDCMPPACVDPALAQPDSHSFVTLPEYVDIVGDVLIERSVPASSPLVCVGMLKGGQLAVECARHFGERVAGMFAIAAVWFTPDAVPLVKNYTIHTRNVKLLPDGSQYLDAWHQPSVAPCDFVNATYCSVWTQKSLHENHLKTLNRARSFETQWQLILAGLDRNDDLINQSLISQIHAPIKYIGWPETAISMWAADGFQPDKLISTMNSAWQDATGGRAVIDYIVNGSEGSMVQNSSYIAYKIHSLLGTSRISVV